MSALYLATPERENEREFRRESARVKRLQDSKGGMQQLTLGTAGSARLDLSDSEGDDEVRDGRAVVTVRVSFPTEPRHKSEEGSALLGLSRAVGDHDSPSVGLGELGGLDRLGDGADLRHEGSARLPE